MSMYGDGSHLVKGMRDADRLAARSRTLTMDDIFDVYGRDPEALASALISACRTIADLKQQAAYDYWPSA